MRYESRRREVEIPSGGMVANMQPAPAPEDEITDPLYKQIKEIFANAKTLTKEESEKVSKELDEYEKKYGVEALNKKLFKDFGLE